MCYSAMVRQDARALAPRYQARIQIEAYESLFARRLAGEKILINKAMEIGFLRSPVSSEERRIADAISAWHGQEADRIQSEIFRQKKRLAEAERLLATRTTKKAETERRVASGKIEKFLTDLKKHRHMEILEEAEARIFPKHYMTMLYADEHGRRTLGPFRYLLRPANKGEDFDVRFSGCYNARLDSLKSVPWWKSALGKRHGIIFVTKFYEHVATEDYLKHFSLSETERGPKSLILSFQPQGVEQMVIPTLWDVWKTPGQPPLFSAALITDNPPEEIARTGHNRVPVFLRESAIDDWLNPGDRSVADIYKILARRETPSYHHEVLRVA